MANPTTRSALMAMGATCIAEVDSLPYEDSARAETSSFTRLGVWWIEDEQRPFIAVVEGLCGPAAEAGMVDRFRAVPYGTLERALNSFDPTNLQADLAEAIDEHGDPAIYPDANTLRRRNAQARRGYQGDGSIEDVMGWLYDDAGDITTNALAHRFDGDFGVPWRTVTHALVKGAPGGWWNGFVSALRHFDRGAWRAGKGGTDAPVQ